MPERKSCSRTMRWSSASPRPPVRLALVLAAALALLAAPARAQELSAKQKEQERLRLTARYLELAREIEPRRLDNHLRELTRYDSRVVGYEGERKAAEYVRAQLEALFPARAREQKF